jgi:hypothetical protein
MNFSLESNDEPGSKQELILKASSGLLDQARTGIRQHCVRHCLSNDAIQACLTPEQNAKPEQDYLGPFAGPAGAGAGAAVAGC